MWRALFVVLALEVWRALALSPGDEGVQLEQPRCPPAAEAAGRCRLGDPITAIEYLATVDGHSIRIKFSVAELYTVECNGNVSLHNDALPRFAVPQRVRTVTVCNCAAPPAGVSYAQALAALGLTPPERTGNYTELVSGYNNLTIKGEQPGHYPSEAHHLADLDALLRLDIENVWSTPLPEIAPQLVSGRLASLRVLRLQGVALAPGALLALPPAVRELHLVNAGANNVPVDALKRLSKLNTLLVEEHGDDGAAVAVGGAPLLKVLCVRAFGGPVRLGGPMPPNLTKLEVQWGRRHGPPAPPVWPQRCPLLELKLNERPVISGNAVGVKRNGSAPQPLPLPRWIANCHNLEKLWVKAPVGTLPASLLTDLAFLQTLTLMQCSLKSLPEYLLSSAVALQHLDLSYNQLQELPNQLFGGTTKLQTLNLSQNKLGVGAAIVVGTATSLQYLKMDHNPLGDLCRGVGSSDVIGIDAPSWLSKLKSLKVLDLSHTHVNRICRDWRQTMEYLDELNLSGTNITQLTYSEMQYKRKEKAFVQMEGIPLDNLQYTPEDYYNATKIASRGALVTVTMDATLDCDCRQYWAALAFRNSHRGVLLQGLRCGPFSFEEVPLERLTCNASELCPGLPEGCACLQRPDIHPPNSLVRLTCENAGLDAVPNVTRDRAHAWTLHLAFNRINRLRPIDLPPNLMEIDLRNNSISHIDADTATVLVGDHVRRLHISGNPLECGCDAHEALAALKGAGDRVDFTEATCDGKPLYVPRRCMLWQWLAAGAGLVGAALAVFAAIASLSRPEARLRLKVALARVGWLPRREAGRQLRFDAFVSYAHQDEEVVRAMASHLEGGRAPLRLCLHQRDWAPGGWIPAQIAASVRASRCTIAVLSEHYVRSGWARAEFREAHAAALRDVRPRLVVVLLDAPDALPLDDELREYLATNTYVRWGDPWFWEKLSVALRPTKSDAEADAKPWTDC